MKVGLVSQSERFNKEIASRDLSTYKVVKRGQLVVGFPIDEGVLGFQNVCDEGIVSPAYQVWDLSTPNMVDPRYLGLYLKSPAALNYYRAKLQGTTARRRSLPRSVFLEIPIPLPPLEEQRRIAGILDKVANLAETARKMLREVAVARSNAIEKVLEKSEESLVRLDSLADIKSGITKGRRVQADTPLSPIPYLAVSNVKDGYLDLTEVKTIDVSPEEREKFSLKDGDLLLTEGGDPDKLGRGTVWREEIPGCLHQNHIFRVRLLVGSPYTPDTLMAILSSRRLKSFFLRSAKQTTGIASINRTQLSSAPIPVLPKNDLMKLESTLALSDQLSQRLNRRLASIEELQSSLQARAFQGEL